MGLKIVIAALVVASSCFADERPRAYELSATIWAEFAARDPAPQPGDICPQCNGTGQVGDGTIFVTCGECNGTGVVPAALSRIMDAADDKFPPLKTRDMFTPSVPPPPVEVRELPRADSHRNTITMHSTSSCEWCVKWWTFQREWFLDQGWTVEKINEAAQPGRLYPYFHIHDVAGRTREFQGYLTPPEFLSLLSE